MNIVEYFVRRSLKRKIASVEERLAALDELINHWAPRHNADGSKPNWMIAQEGEYRAERAKLRKRLERLLSELANETRKERDV